MKKVIYMLAGLAALSLASCEDSKEPVLETPTSFTLNESSLADQYLATTGDADDPATFNLFCSQPDYGISVVAEYGAQVSLAPEFVDATDAQEANYYALANSKTGSAAMTFRTYDLAVALTKLLGFEDKDQFDAYVAAGNPTVLPVYVRATCQVPGAPSSAIVSNVITLNRVQLSYAKPTRGVIYLVGNLINPATGTSLNWLEPSEGNAKAYRDFTLIEPEIGCKLYAGTYDLTAGGDGSFRFTAKLNGWKGSDDMVGSQPDDGNVDITEKFVDGLYKDSAVRGKGNWDIKKQDAGAPVTLVVSLQDPKAPKVWFRMGRWDVEVQLDANNKNEPKFVAPVE